MITTSEGQFFPEPGHDCSPIRMWSETVDEGFIAVHLLSYDERRHINAFVFLDADDALNSAKDLQQSVEKQRRWLDNLAESTEVCNCECGNFAHEPNGLLAPKSN